MPVCSHPTSVGVCRPMPVCSHPISLLVCLMSVCFTHDFFGPSRVYFYTWLLCLSVTSPFCFNLISLVVSPVLVCSHMTYLSVLCLCVDTWPLCLSVLYLTVDTWLLCLSVWCLCWHMTSVFICLVPVCSHVTSMVVCLVPVLTRLLCLSVLCMCVTHDLDRHETHEQRNRVWTHRHGTTDTHRSWVWAYRHERGSQECETRWQQCRQWGRTTELDPTGPCLLHVTDNPPNRVKASEWGIRNINTVYSQLVHVLSVHA